jgi:hypothetical protein
MTEDRMEDALARHFGRKLIDDQAVARVVARLEALPRQKSATSWPQILLDWQFAPAWPRVAALACCAVLGFAIGSIGVNQFSRASVVAGDLTSLVSEPEALTGARP